VVGYCTSSTLPSLKEGEDDYSIIGVGDAAGKGI